MTETRIDRYPIAGQPSQRSADDLVHVLSAIEDSQLSGTSEVVERYERRLADVYSTNTAVAVTSGSIAVAAVLDGLGPAPRWGSGADTTRAAGIQMADEVIVSPAAPVCTVLPILERGLTPRFCDVRPDNFGLEPADLTNLISAKTLAVIEVPMWGYPVAIDETADLVAGAGTDVAFVADLAHCHYTRLHGRLLADYADVACFSTHESKFLSTGEGGYVVTNDVELGRRIRSATRFGDLTGDLPGLNMKLGGLQAGLGLARLDRTSVRSARRLANRAHILDHLNNPRIRELPIAAGGGVDGYSLLLQAVDVDGRELVRHQVANDVPSDIHKYDNRPLYHLPLLRDFRRECANAESLLRSLTTVPIHEELNPNDLAHIVDVLNRF